MSLDNPQAVEVVRITKLMKGYVINALGGYTVACKDAEHLATELREIALTLENVRVGGVPPTPEPLPQERGVDYSTPPENPTEMARDPEIQRVNLWQATKALVEGLIGSEDWERARGAYFPDLSPEEVSQCITAVEMETPREVAEATPPPPEPEKVLVSDDVIAGLKRIDDAPTTTTAGNATRRRRRVKSVVGGKGTGDAQAK